MRERRRGLLVPAIVLIIIGLVGVAVAVAVLAAGDAGSFGPSGSGGGGASRPATGGSGESGGNGESIYFTGSGHDGPIRIEWDPGGRSGMMGRRPGRGFARMGCADCHGSDGLGTSTGMMFSASTPDIRYDALTANLDEGGEGWSGADVAAAIRDGVTPDGEVLDPMMPRWNMDGIDMAGTVGFLKTLE